MGLLKSLGLAALLAFSSVTTADADHRHRDRHHHSRVQIILGAPALPQCGPVYAVPSPYYCPPVYIYPQEIRVRIPLGRDFSIDMPLARPEPRPYHPAPYYPQQYYQPTPYYPY